MQTQYYYCDGYRVHIYSISGVRYILESGTVASFNRVL